ncbi:MAG TPA: hypothetical protein VEV43_00765 [Actinomycetota bacterium]|nr:hypothetical protein [Actinomycetota bacterium]
MGSKSTFVERIAHSRAPQIAVGLVLVLFVGVAWWRFSDASVLEEMTVKKRAGIVTVLRGGETIEVGDSTSLKPRDVVQTHSSGEAVIRLEGDRLLTLAPDSKVRVRDARGVESQGGSLLADTSESLTVTFGGTRASTSSATIRIDRGISAARVGSYEGRVTLSAPGEERLVIGRLFQASPSVNFMPESAVPYDFNVADQWDRLHLDRVIALQEELDQLSAGLETQVEGERPGLDYFSALQDGADVSFLKPYLRRDPINLLVGFTIASHEDGPLGASFRRAFDLFDRGAEWSVAATIMGVKLEAVLADLEDIATVAVEAASGGDDSFTAAAAVLAEGGKLPPPGTGPVPTNAPPGTNPPPTQPPPSPTDKPNPPDECSNVVTCGAEDLTEPLEPTPSPSPGPTDDPDEGEDEGPLQILNQGGKGIKDAVGGL